MANTGVGHIATGNYGNREELKEAVKFLTRETSKPNWSQVSRVTGVSPRTVKRLVAEIEADRKAKFERDREACRQRAYQRAEEIERAHLEKTLRDHRSRGAAFLFAILIVSIIAAFAIIGEY